MTLYRCGWCGTPTDEFGRCLTPSEFSQMIGDWDNATQTSGECCPNGDVQSAIDERQSEFYRELRRDAFGEQHHD